MPRTHAWTRKQRLLIVAVVVFAFCSFCALVYSYERYYRGLREADLAGTWTRVDPGSGGGYYEFRRDGTMVMLDDDGQPSNVIGKWYAGGSNIYVRLPPSDFRERELVVWHIVDISRDQFRVRIWQDDKGLAVWRRMKPTAPFRNNLSVFATTPSTSSRFPTSLVRFGYSPSRTPAVLFFNDCRGLSLSR